MISSCFASKIIDDRNQATNTIDMSACTLGRLNSTSTKKQVSFFIYIKFFCFQHLSQMDCVLHIRLIFYPSLQFVYVFLANKYLVRHTISCLKVSQFRKQFMVCLLLPKNERKNLFYLLFYSSWQTNQIRPFIFWENLRLANLLFEIN